MLWDIFCKVIDNHGDVGVCWRLSAQLAARGHEVRLWVDDASALRWMAPGGRSGVHVLPWGPQPGPPPEPGDAVIEAFGCELDLPFQAAIAAKARAQGGRQPLWINLEYLTAESFAERGHGLPSPVSAGPAAGLVKRFYYPGFTPRTGGLLREGDLLERQARFDRESWLRSHGIEAGGSRLVSLFCYEPPVLGALLAQWVQGPEPVHLLVTAGRATVAVQAAMAGRAPSHLTISYLPLLSQLDFDHLLWSCDLNFVRGEDSLVRALWAGAPLVWHIYPQHDDAHHGKLSAFLDWLGAPASLRALHGAWNGLENSLPALDIPAWSACVQAARASLLAQDDLATQLLRLAGSSQKR